MKPNILGTFKLVYTKLIFEKATSVGNNNISLRAIQNKNYFKLKHS